MVRFTKPAWVIHKDPSKSDQNTKRFSIFSVHVHPDGSRIATGGLDSKIRIWSTKPILNRSSELSGKPPKSLCTLHMHTGPVLTVRWAYSGRWLASGSDDAIVMIWDLDPNARGKVWGSDEVNVEGWKPLKRLPGHDSDVTDVAWSPGDRYLASVGLDSTVIIWCGFTLERIVRLNQHQGFVKGVCWDPVGEFLATQSDDRTVKIWRTTDWSLEKTVSKPFEASPGSTFFRRLSWSPDGAHITASNATNNNGFVFIAAVITRNSWTSDISLVGHENTIEVAAYNPHIFLRNTAEPVATYNICSVVALGADDRSVSVWQTKSARPLIVAKEVFDRQIMDLSWSWDGMTLYAASSDGTIAVFNFDPGELEGISPHSVQQQYLTKFGFTPPPLPEGFSHIPAREPTQMTPPPSPTRANGQPSAQAQQTTSTSFPTVNGGERINVLVAKRSSKKRTTLSQVPSTAVNGRMDTSPGVAGSSVPSASAPTSKRLQLTYHSDVQSFPSPSEQLYNAPDSWFRHADVPMDVDVPIDALDTTSPQTKGRRTAIGDLLDESKPPRARTLGGDRQREAVKAKEIGSVVPVSAMALDIQRGMMLPVPPLLTYLTSEVDGTDDVLEAENAEDAEGTNEVSFVSGKQTQWLDFLPSPALALKATSFFCAVAMQDGSVNVYSHKGRRLVPAMSLGSPCSFIDGNKNTLLVVTSSGLLYSWNIKKQAINFPSVSVSPLLAPSPNHTIVSASVRSNGMPVINTSNGVAYSYDTSLATWVKVSERWWAEGSDAWQGRQRVTNAVANRGVISLIEGSVNGTPPPDETSAEKKRPGWWNVALTLGHLETKLHAARLLDSPVEYKQALLVYARRIADEGFRAKGEELIKELFGPMYWRPGREEGWTPNVAGMAKRDLLKEVLTIFARSKTLTKLALDWQDVLKRAASDEP